MKVLRCESNLAGFLTAIYHYYYHHKDAGAIYSGDNDNLIDEVVFIRADVEVARKVRDGIINKITGSGYKDISDAYLSYDANKESKLFNYLKLVFSKGMQVYSMYSCPEIVAFNDMVKKVRHEVHRMHGFIRFQEMDNGVYYAYFGGDNDILELLLPHFKARFNSQKFILHDIKRRKMAYYDGEQCHTFLAPDKVNIAITESELLISNLWKDYNKNVAIDERRNIRLQNHFAPKKYRWFMNEF